ncbi:MAG TPA: metallophosphoesterase [Polyangiaceae bacterium]|jgi:predicted MPP superfamily phosphohydrolase|nr:metallophosphoesterase [Polyangiaceae bacterium]
MRSWSSFALFFSIVVAIIGGVHYYLFSRLVRAPGLEAWQRPGGIVFLLGAILLPLGMLASRVLPRAIASVIASVAYVWMGLVVLLFFLTLGSEVIRVGASILSGLNVVPLDDGRRLFLSRVLAGTVGVLGAGLGIRGYLSARGAVGVKKVEVGLTRLPEALGGFKIAQLSDLHIGPTLGREWLTDVVARTNALEPDIVAITGDLVDGSVSELGEHVAPLGDLRAKHGVYFVTGNHEYYSGVDAWIARLRELGVRVLRNERVSIGDGDASFDLAGIDDYRAKDFGNGHGADLDKAIAGRDPARELVLLAHQPKAALEAATKGVGLQLSGHTHGGQIFPWGFFVRLDQHFVAGLDKVGDLLLYTSSGTGYWGPPMRVGAPPEITLLQLSRIG